MTRKTRVACAIDGDNLLLGHRTTDWSRSPSRDWQIWSRLAQGPALSADDCEYLDAIRIAVSAADPRIFPLKLVRLVSEGAAAGQGVAVASWCAVQAMAGPKFGADVCQWLQAYERWLEENGQPEEFFRRERRLPGFGVLFRPVDERLVILATVVERFGRSERRWWRLAVQAREIAQGLGWPAGNLLSGLFPALMDLGLSPRASVFFAQQMVYLSYACNAYEAAENPERMVFAEDAIRYCGPEPRSLEKR